MCGFNNIGIMEEEGENDIDGIIDRCNVKSGPTILEASQRLTLILISEYLGSRVHGGSVLKQDAHRLSICRERCSMKGGIPALHKG